MALPGSGEERHEPPIDLVPVHGVHTGLGTPISGGDPAGWLLHHGRAIEPETALFDELCWRLIGSGIPLWRATLHVSTLHPQMIGFGCRWWRDRNLTEAFTIALGIERSPEFLHNPIRPAILDGEVVRHRLGETDDGFPLLRHLREAGATDYLASPLFRAGDRHPTVTWATDAPHGFTEEDIAHLAAVVPTLALVVETRAARRVSSNLLETYLGRLAGPRVLAGQVRRGRGERLRAVVMASDLRGSTDMAERLPGEDVIGLLDAYFECVAERVLAHGGDVLKFIGDGVLSIFPVEGDEPAAAGAALAAAAEALAGLDRLSHERLASAGCALRAGFGLHVGDVIYGNVGASNRLDFTAIGPTVNLAFRLEGLTKHLGRPLLASAAFAAAAPERLVFLGSQLLRGIAEPQGVFGLSLSGPEAPA